MLKIDLFCNDGSPLGLIPADIEERGVGGAELAMMTWAETMGSRGHEVRVFNNPAIAGEHGNVTYLPQDQFYPPEGRDVFIIYRSPNKHIQTARAEMTIHWSCDQQTSGNYAQHIVPHVDRIVCISPYHQDYYVNRYKAPEEKIGYFDLGVRTADYQQQIEKVSGRCIYCSVPGRGLDFLQMMWGEVRKALPHLELLITADYRLWGAQAPLDHQHRLKWIGESGVIYTGKIPREELVKEQLKAEYHLFPCDYEELFCISAAECQVAGAVPITSNAGALRTTNEFGIVLPGDPANPTWRQGYIKEVIDLISGNLWDSDKMRQQAVKRFDWNVICGQWEYLFKTGEYETKEEKVAIITD